MQSLPPPSITSALTPAHTVQVARVTGASLPGETLPSPNRTDTRDQVTGTDLGIMWATGDRTVMIAFGDTYGKGWGGVGGGPPEGDWRSNTLALSDDSDPAHGLVFTSMIHDTPGHAGELLPALRDAVEHTIIPTAGVSVGSRQYIHFMSVHHWGAPNYWQTNFSGIAYSDDRGRTWSRASAPVWKNTPLWNDPFQQGAFVKSDGFVYLFGTPNGRQGDIFLARVPSSDILDKAAYQYWNGHDWQSDEAAAIPVAKGPASELSFAYNSHFRRWLMLTLDVPQKALVLRDAAALTGPWSAPKIVAGSAEFPGLYGGYIDPLHNDGKDFYFTLSLWVPYNVFWMHTILEAEP